MNLRSEIHAAIDEIAQPAPALSRDAVEFALSDGRDRGRKPVRSHSRWALEMRRAGSLVAAALVIVMMVTVVVGGRLWRDWNKQQQNLTQQAQVAQLGERPLNLPIVRPGAACPASPVNLYPGYFGGYGSGPIYADGTGFRYGLPSGTFFDTGYSPVSDFSGIVLIRGRDLITKQTVVFAKPPYPAVATAIPSGKVTGTEKILGVKVELHDELLLDTSQLLPDPDAWWETVEGFPTGSSGCIGVQADGVTAEGAVFSEVIVLTFSMMN